MLLILFGLPGAGKNFTGMALAGLLDAHFHDADEDLSAEMRDSINRRIPLTDEIRDRYYEIVVQRIRELKAEHPRLIVAQALIRNRHRQLIRRAHPEAQFVLVDAPPDLRLERLRRRDPEQVDRITPEYAAVIEAAFEPPTHPYHTLINDADADAVCARLDALGLQLSDGDRRPRICEG